MDASDFQRLRYGYDDVGNVTSLINDIQGALAASQRGGRVEQTFTYDDLHRLDTAAGTWTEPGGARNSYTLDLNYDAIHNITRKVQIHSVSRQGNGHPVPQRRTSYDWTYEYDGPQPHAPSVVGDQSFSFDASGRMVSRQQQGMGAPRRTLIWDSEDRIRAIQDGGAAVVDDQGNVVAGRGRTTEFVYDAEGNRISKSGAQGHTAYVNAHYTLRNETIATKHVFIGASRISSKIVPGQQAALPMDTDDVSHMLGRWWLHRSANGWEHARNTEQNPHYRQPTQMPSPMGLPEANFLYFYHPDHLGSTSFVTDGGEVYEHVQYFPHGEVWADERSNTERLPYLFTGKEFDQETELYDFGARMYDPRVALWASPDPALPDYLREIADAPSSLVRLAPSMYWSAYLYSGGNPLTFVDPDGRRYRISNVADRVRYQQALQSMSNRQIDIDEDGVVHMGARINDDPGNAGTTTLLWRGIQSERTVDLIIFEDPSLEGGDSLAMSQDATNGVGSDVVLSWNPSNPASFTDADGNLQADARRDLVEELVHADRQQRGVQIPMRITANEVNARGPERALEELVANGIPYDPSTVSSPVRASQLRQDITVNSVQRDRGEPVRIKY